LSPNETLEQPRQSTSLSSTPFEISDDDERLQVLVQDPHPGGLRRGQVLSADALLGRPVYRKVSVHGGRGLQGAHRGGGRPGGEAPDLGHRRRGALQVGAAGLLSRCPWHPARLRHHIGQQFPEHRWLAGGDPSQLPGRGQRPAGGQQVRRPGGPPGEPAAGGPLCGLPGHRLSRGLRQEWRQCESHIRRLGSQYFQSTGGKTLSSQSNAGRAGYKGRRRGAGGQGEATSPTSPTSSQDPAGRLSSPAAQTCRLLLLRNFLLICTYIFFKFFFLQGLQNQDPKNI